MELGTPRNPLCLFFFLLHYTALPRGARRSLCGTGPVVYTSRSCLFIGVGERLTHVILTNRHRFGPMTRVMLFRRGSQSPENGSRAQSINPRTSVNSKPSYHLEIWCRKCLGLSTSLRETLGPRLGSLSAPCVAVLIGPLSHHSCQEYIFRPPETWKVEC